MFFGKKKEKVDPENEAKFQELSLKWDVFLKKIEQRFDESLEHSHEAAVAGLVESDYNIHATNRAWTAMQGKLMELGDKIDTTYEQNVKPQMLEVRENWSLVEEGVKGRALRSTIFKRIRRHEIVVSGAFSQKFFDHAVSLLDGDFKCAQCTADLKVGQDIFRSHYVSCNYCDTVNTFEPNSKVSEIRHSAVDNIARHNALKEWDDLEQAIYDLKGTKRPVQGENMSEYKTAYENREVYEKLYWHRFLKEKIKIMPELDECFKTDYEHKMMMFYQERKRELNY